MEEYNCRTCLAVTDRKKCTEITKKCGVQRTLKEVIIYLVPEMETTLSDDELICRSCVRTLKLVMKFIEGCLDAEFVKSENKEYTENDGDDADQYNSTSEVHIKHEDSDYDEETADDTYYYEEYSDGDENTDELDPKEKGLSSDHDYMNKPNVAGKSECEDSNLEIASPENKDEIRSGRKIIKYSSGAEIPDGQEPENNSNFNRPIEIIYDDSLMIHKGDNQEGSIILSDAGEGVYVEQYQSDQEQDQENKILPCSVCSEVFTSYAEYKTHLEIHPPFKCQYCDKGLTTEIAYKSHILWHKEKGFRMCEFCGRCFKSSGALIMHINCVHDEENIYTCELCPKQYKQKFKLESHVRTVHMQMGQYQCEECGKCFQTKEANESHYRLIHLQVKPFACEICGAQFGRKDYLQKHLIRHKNGEISMEKVGAKMRAQRIRLKNPGKPVTCRVCNKQIKSVHLLKAHLQTHVRIKRHKCRFCELTFTLGTNRDRHEKLHESDPENKFRCNICWKRVKTEEDLERHVAGHVNRPAQHSCDICGEKFHRRYLVDNHLLEKHTGPGDIEKAEEEIVFKNLLEYVDPRLLD